MNEDEYIAGVFIEAATRKPYSCKLVDRTIFGRHVYDIIFEETPIRRVFMDREDVESYLAVLNGAWLMGWGAGFGAGERVHMVRSMKKEIEVE